MSSSSDDDEELIEDWLEEEPQAVDPPNGQHHGGGGGGLHRTDGKIRTTQFESSSEEESDDEMLEDWLEEEEFLDDDTEEVEQRKIMMQSYRRKSITSRQLTRDPGASPVSPSRRHSSIAADESLARAALKTTLLEADVSQDICGKFMDALRTKECDKGEYVIRQGDIGDTFFVIEAGECLITETKAGEAKERNIVTLYATAWFGERALVKEEPRVANVKAKVDGTKLLFMDKATFKEFLALDEAFLHVVTAITKKTEEIRAKRAQVKVQKEATHRTVDVKKLEERTRETTAVTTITKSQINNYRVVKLLGKGSYGTVKLVEDTKSRRRQRYAMKILKRSALARQKLSAGGGGGDSGGMDEIRREIAIMPVKILQRTFLDWTPCFS